MTSGRSHAAPEVALRHVLAGALIAGGLLWGTDALLGGAASGRRPAAVVAAAATTLAASTLAGVTALDRGIGRRWGLGAQALLAGAVAALTTARLVQHLFDGGRLSRLPGAHLGPPLLAAAAGLAAAAARAVGPRLWARRPRAAGVWAVGGGLLLDLAGRLVRPDEHPDPHLLLAIAAYAAVALGAATLLAAGTGRRPARPPVPSTPRSFVPHLHRGAVGAALAAGLGCLAVAASWNEDDLATLLALRTAGHDTRLLLRGLRSLSDRDGDGVSGLFGGGDCAPADPSVHPGAFDVPGDGLDQDCDGRDAAPPPPGTAALGDRAPPWRTPEGTRLLAGLRGKNVLVLSVDTLRYDAAAGEGPFAPAPPHLARLFEESVFFRRAFAPAAGTDLSMAAYWTGRLDAFDRPVAATLGERLVQRGYRTAAVLPRETLRYVGRTLLSRGIERLVPLVNDRRVRDLGDRSTTADTVRLGRAELDRLASDEGPWFLWLHFFDVHEHHEIRATDPALVRAAGGVPPRGRGARYRAALSLVDDGVGTILAELSARNLAEDTVVVFFSDHGEGLGEDPRLPENHGLVLYGPLVHVPVAIRLPGAAGRPSPVPVTLGDLHGTICALVGACAVEDLGPAPMLAALLDPAARPPSRPLPLYEQRQRGVILWPHVLLLSREDAAVEVYDLEEDPEQKENLYGRDPALLQRLRSALARVPAIQLDRTRKGRRARERVAARRP